MPWAGLGLLLIFMWLLPLLLIRHAGIPAWQVRAASLVLMAVALPVLTLAWSLAPWFSFRGRGGGKSRKRSTRWSKASGGIRVLAAAFAGILLFYWTLPVARDVQGLRSGDVPNRVSGSVTRVSTSRGAPTVSLVFREAPRSQRPKESYACIALNPPEEGDRVEMLVLPHSRVALDWWPSE